MAHPLKHSETSAKKFGGKPQDYLPIHNWFDESKAFFADFRHRALRHHAEGVFLAERIFGIAVTNSEGIEVPVRYIAEQHINGERSERTVDPLGLVAKGSAWYLVANTSAGMRTFRVSRIERATSMNESCRRPRDFNLAAYWTSVTKEVSEARKNFPATLRLDPQAAKWMLTWHCAKQVGSADSKGRALINLEFENEDDARFVALGLGTRVEVVQPKSLLAYLRKEVAGLHAQLRNASA